MGLTTGRSADRFVAAPPECRSMTDVHVVLACGLAELVTVRGAALALGARPGRTILVLYGRPISMPPAHRNEVMRHAGIFGAWDHIIDACEFPAEAYEGDRHALLAALGNDIEVLREASTVFTHTLWKPFERALLQLMPNAQLILFDNGLDSHQPRKIEESPQPNTSNTIDSRDASRTALRFYSLGDLLGVPEHLGDSPVAIPTGEDLAGLYREASLACGGELLGSVVPQAGPPLLLAIGTSFNRLPRVSFEEEADIYRRLANWAHDRGYQVLFKEHPRSHAPVAEAPGVADIVWRSSLPIELAAAGARDVAIAASVSSTALLTMFKAFGTEARLVGAHLRKKLNLAWRTELESLLGEDIKLSGDP